MQKTVRNLSVLATLAAVLGLIDAYGSTCPTLNPPTDPTSKLYVMYALNWVFLVTTSLTWAVGFAWFMLIWALRTGKSWFYTTSVIVSAVGALSGFVPAALVMANGMPSSPSLMRAFLNLFILIYLVKPARAAQIKDLFVTGGTTPGVSAKTMMYILTAVGMLLMLQPIVVPWTHIIDGVYEYGYESLQFFGGLFSVLLAGSIALSERLRVANVQLSVAARREVDARLD